MQSNSNIENFKLYGNLNILQTFRGQNQAERSIPLELLKFGFFFCFWFTVILSVATAIAYGFGYIVPWIAENVLGFIAQWDLLEPYRKLIFPFVIWLKYLSPIMTVLGFLAVNAMFLVLFERKVLAIFTNRLGPNRVGFNGIFQTVADSLKLLFKEDIVPASADKVLFFLAPMLFFAPSIICFLPLLSVASGGIGLFEGTQFSASLFFVVGFAALATLGLVLAGWASHSKYSLIGGLRVTAQAISYEIPLILSIIAFVILVNSVDLLEISQNQSKNLLHWNIFAGGELLNIIQYFSELMNNFWVGVQHFTLLILKGILFVGLAFVIYFCSLAEVNRTPFDLPEAESELVGGFSTEYTGIKFALFFLAEYTNLFISSCLFAILFLGGGNLGIFDFELKSILSQIDLFGVIFNFSWVVSTVALLMKAYLLIAGAIWIRATLPRFRADQLMILAWKYLIPVSLSMIFLASLCLLLK